MTVRVGIPRALGYFDFYPLWEKFFHELGATVVLSSSSCKEIIDRGVRSAVDGTCLPVKAFYGHVISLCDKRLDFIFLPRLVSVASREFICPKFMGIPDTVALAGLPTVLSPVIDLSRGNFSLYRAVYDTGRRFTSNPVKILAAYRDGARALQAYRNLLRKGIQPEEAMSMALRGEENLPKCRENTLNGLRIGLLGHSYLLYDSYISMNIRKKLAEMGATVITPDMLPEEVISRQAGRWPKKMFWTSGRKMLGAVLHFIENAVDGIIYMAAFGCGTDSFTGDLVQRISNRRGTPCLLLNIDEHTGEAGIITRLEAFTDMIRWGASG